VLRAAQGCRQSLLVRIGAVKRSGFVLCVVLTSLLQIAVAQSPESSETDYRARTIYFLLADRFNPHHPYDPYVDPQYPDATNTVNCFAVPCTTDPEFRSYWGGDIEGINEKIGYLKRLGVSAVWVTPLMENVPQYEAGTGYGTGYHGYWIQNYYRVNPHFGGWKDVDKLSETLHAAGMQYMQDITLNHSNPLDNHSFGRLYRSAPADNAPEKVFINSYNDDYDPVHGGRYYKHYNDDPRCEEVVKDYAEIVPDSQWTYWQLHHCLLADLSGYNQHDPAVAQYLVGAGKEWMKHGADDFRLDAIKFPFPDFVAEFTHSMIHQSHELGRPSPYIVGEWSNGGVGDAKSLHFANSYRRFATNILDFQLSFELNRFVGGSYEYSTEQRSAEQLDRFLHQRVAAFEGRDTWQGTFIDNHDQMRTMVRLDKLGVSPESERARRLDLATVLLLTVRGIPIIFYGDEQYLAHYQDSHDTPPEYVNSDDDDPYNRVGMQRWDEDTSAFRIIQRLTKVRKESPAVWKGEYKTVYASGDVLVFERRLEDEVALVAVNRGGRTKLDLGSRTDLPKGFYRGVLQDTGEANEHNSITVTAQRATLRLNRLSSLVVWVRDGREQAVATSGSA
jgi:cyclomaltodextrin glucanotransferase